MFRVLITFSFILALTSCSMFQIRKPPIEQGNIITPELSSQLHRGMSAAEVTQVMGTPVLTNLLTPNRIEYVYTFQYGQSPRTEKRISCIFENGHLKEIIKN